MEQKADGKSFQIDRDRLYWLVCVRERQKETNKKRKEKEEEEEKEVRKT